MVYHQLVQSGFLRVHDYVRNMCMVLIRYDIGYIGRRNYMQDKRRNYHRHEHQEHLQRCTCLTLSVALEPLCRTIQARQECVTKKTAWKKQQRPMPRRQRNDQQQVNPGREHEPTNQQYDHAHAKKNGQSHQQAEEHRRQQAEKGRP